MTTMTTAPAVSAAPCPDVPQVDLSVAQKFLSTLAGDDPVCFQTFDDQPAKRPDLLSQFHATFQSSSDSLLALNAAGAGIFVTVNKTDGRGRKNENVVGLRALFIDGDDLPLPARWGIEPNMIVQRDERHWHAYWLLSPDQPLDQFSAAQKQLAQFYGSDPKISDLPRVMRLPGFLHQKATPVPVRLIRCESAPRRAVAEILAAHPVTATPLPISVAPIPDLRGPAASPTDERLLARARQYLGGCPPSISGQRGHDAALWAARVLVIGFDLPMDAARLLLYEWNRGCQPPWSIPELEHKLKDAAEKPFDKPRGWGDLEL